MAFPEFEDGGRKILFFSRGLGRGHAVPDMEIAREMEALAPDAQVRLVSYGTGSDTFARRGVRHISLGLPDRNPIHETSILAGRLIGWLEPDLVVAHEEFPVLPTAKIFDKPTILITDWFTGPEKYSTSTLPFADRIIFLDQPGYFEEPSEAGGRVEYVGPVVKKLSYTRGDRQRAREELGLRPESFVLAALPGSCREADTPIAQLVLDTFDCLPMEKQMVWVAGEDESAVRDLAAGRENVFVKDYDPIIERIMAAADIAITKGTRKTLHELTALGVPSVSLSSGANPIDDIRARHFPGNEALNARITAEELTDAIVRGARRSVAPVKNGAGARECARSILSG